MTDDLIKLLQEAITGLEKTGSELRTTVQTSLITIRFPAGIMRDLSAADFPDAAALKKSLSALHATLEHAQEIVRRLIDRITVVSGTTEMLIDEIGEKR